MKKANKKKRNYQNPNLGKENYMKRRLLEQALTVEESMILSLVTQQVAGYMVGKLKDYKNNWDYIL